jgi:tRNA(Arg) A34 adenosine deaminase TadA
VSTPNTDHEKFLRRAIEMSERAALEYSTGGAFGAVLVKGRQDHQ